MREEEIRHVIETVQSVASAAAGKASVGASAARG
jgi:hypothetical protein